MFRWIACSGADALQVEVTSRRFLHGLPEAQHDALRERMGDTTRGNRHMIPLATGPPAAQASPLALESEDHARLGCQSGGPHTAKTTHNFRPRLSHRMPGLLFRGGHIGKAPPE
jgi:hypothetical protein